MKKQKAFSSRWRYFPCISIFIHHHDGRVRLCLDARSCMDKILFLCESIVDLVSLLKNKLKLDFLAKKNTKKKAYFMWYPSSLHLLKWIVLNFQWKRKLCSAMFVLMTSLSNAMENASIFFMCKLSNWCGVFPCAKRKFSTNFHWFMILQGSRGSEPPFLAFANMSFRKVRKHKVTKRSYIFFIYKITQMQMVSFTFLFC